MIQKLLRENPIAMIFSSFHLVSSLAVGVIAPFMSLVMLDKGFSTSEITLFFAIFTFATFFFSPIIGKISDEIGRKKIILFGILCQIIFFTIYYFIENKTIIFIIRFFDGITYSCIFLVMLGAFQNMIKEKRGFWTGIYLSVGTIGALAGPVVAGYISEWSSSQILFLVSIILFILSFLFLLFIPQTEKIKHKISIKDFNPLSEIKHFLKFKELKGMALLGILMNSKGEIYNIFFPILVVTTLNLPKHYLGFLLSIPIFFHIFQFYFGKITDKVSAEFGVMLGVFLAATSIILLPYANTLYKLIAILVIYGIGGGIWNVNAWSLMGEIAKKYNMQGEVVGTYISLAKLGVFFTTLASAFIINIFGISKTLQLFAITILFGNIVVYFFFQPIFHHKKHKHMFHQFFEHEENKQAVLIKTKE